MRVPSALKDDKEKLKKFLEAAVDAINKKDTKIKITNFGFYKFRLEITSSHIVSTIGGKKNPFLEFYESWISAARFLSNFTRKKFNNTQNPNLILAVDVLNYDVFSLLAKNFVAIKYLPEKLDGSKDVDIVTLRSLVLSDLLTFSLTGEAFLNINLYIFGEFSIKSLNVKGIFIPIPSDTITLPKRFETIYQVADFLKAHKALTLDAERVEFF
ncbi:hypothetical protein PGDDIFCJ_00169 [Thermus phage YS40_Isch]|nr:hypothetical protein PGDDIFCJ_00169 [Thermus phage YS40_Isch]